MSRNNLYDEDADLSLFAPEQVFEMMSYKSRVIHRELGMTILELFEDTIRDYPDPENWTERDYWAWEYLTNRLRDRIHIMEGTLNASS